MDADILEKGAEVGKHQGQGKMESRSWEDCEDQMRGKDGKWVGPNGKQWYNVVVSDPHTCTGDSVDRHEDTRSKEALFWGLTILDMGSVKLCRLQ